DYNLYRHALLSGDAALTGFRPDLVLVALDENAVALSHPPDAAKSHIEGELDREIDAIKQLWKCIRERYGAPPVQQTLLSLTAPVFGNYEGIVPGSSSAVVDAFNARLREAARDEKALLVAIAWEAGRRGFVPELVDPVRWHHAKQLVSPVFTPFYGDL